MRTRNKLYTAMLLSVWAISSAQAQNQVSTNNASQPEEQEVTIKGTMSIDYIHDTTVQPDTFAGKSGNGGTAMVALPWWR